MCTAKVKYLWNWKGETKEALTVKVGLPSAKATSERFLNGHCCDVAW